MFSYLCQVTNIFLPLIATGKEAGSINIVINKLDVERLVYMEFGNARSPCASFLQI